MNFLTFFRVLVEFFLSILLFIFIKKRIRKRPKISLLIPFSSNDPQRRKNFAWVLRYWAAELPDAEIVVGSSSYGIFCKGQALNRAARKARGKILVIMDADAYISGESINHCADMILSQREKGNKMWYIPYRNLYRLTQEATDLVLSSDPALPVRFSSPPPLSLVENNGAKSSYGHRFGAMCMIFPREAYDTLGGFDERFKGWGGEDVALLRALDTLYGKHKTIENDILHLWHPFYGETYQTRKWVGQKGGSANSKLSNAYHAATRQPTKMRALVEEGHKHRKK